MEGVARRAAFVVTAALAVVAVGLWLTPFVVSGNKGYPFGCGSAAHPNATGLGRQVCGTAVDARSLLVLALVVAAVVCGLAAGLLPARLSRYLPAVLCAAPLLAVAAFLLFAPVEARGTDGSSVTCGRPVAPATDPFTAGLCADLPGNRAGTGLTVAALAVVLGLGLAFVRPARRPGEAPVLTAEAPPALLADPASRARPADPAQVPPFRSAGPR